MTMATETLQQPQDPRGGGGGSGLKGAVLCKQPEIEEDEQDTSPGSDQSDATITATGQYSVLGSEGCCQSRGLCGD